MIDRDIAGRPAMLFPVSRVRRGGLRLLTFDARDPFAIQENRYAIPVVPCAIGNFSHFVNTQASTVNKINPCRGRNWWSFWLDSLCCRSSLISRYGFLVPVFDLSNSAINALRSSLKAVPDRVALFPCVVDVERYTVVIDDSLTNDLTGLRAGLGRRQCRRRQDDLLSLAPALRD